MKTKEAIRENAINNADAFIEETYNLGYADGFKKGQIEGYETTTIWQDGFYKGLEEAWECAKKIVCSPDDGGMSLCEMDKAFGFNVIHTYEVFKTYTANEAIEKIRAYEDEQKGRVTRESIIKSGIEEIAESFSLDEISKVLEQMKGAAE